MEEAHALGRRLDARQLRGGPSSPALRLQLGGDLVQALGALLLPEGGVDDAVTMVFELATNVFAHALGGQPLATMPTAGLPEVQIYGRGWGTEVVVRVFDSAAWCGTVPSTAGLRPPVDAEGGRGLGLVDAGVCAGFWEGRLLRAPGGCGLESASAGLP